MTRSKTPTSAIWRFEVQQEPALFRKELNDIVVARKNEPSHNGCLLRRDVKLHKTGDFVHPGETDDSPNGPFFTTNPIIDESKPIFTSDRFPAYTVVMKVNATQGA